jgi:hypothetical protein
MEIQECSVCKSAAELRCGRCKKANYCSKECQVSDWRAHKITCGQVVTERVETVRANYIQHAHVRIAGNIITMAAHKFTKNGPGVIVVEITETIEEFCSRGRTETFHFAHLNYVEDSTRVDQSVITVKYQFDNYQYQMAFKHGTDFSTLVKDQPPPENDWSIIFTM